MYGTFTHNDKQDIVEAALHGVVAIFTYIMLYLIVGAAYNCLLV